MKAASASGNCRETKRISIGWTNRERDERTHLEDHEAGVPALSLSLVHACGERGRGHEAIGSVGGGARLANDELLEVDAVLLDLEHRRARECTSRLSEETLAVGVETLVVELDVVL